jgi:hypothetical protein
MSDSGDKYGLVEAQVVEFEEAFGKFISDESKSVPTSKVRSSLSILTLCLFYHYYMHHLTTYTHIYINIYMNTAG